MLRSGETACGEGPFRTEYAEQKLVGRVVGVFVPKVGAEREAAR